MSSRTETPAKAWVGASLAALCAASGAVEHGIGWGDVPIIIGAFVAGYQGVYWTRNRKLPTRKE